MKKLFAFLVTAIVISAAYAVVNTVASAQCVPVYGYGVTCPPGVNIAVNKTVQNPQSNVFVDNLGVNDPKFSAEQIVNFQIVVTNTGGTSIARVVVKDTLPQFVTFVSGPGNFDNATKTLTFEVTSLNVGESRTFSVQARTVAERDMPQDVGIACVVNQANVTTNDNKTASDASQFCIERKVLGAAQVFPPSKVTVIPVTGPSALYFLAFIPTALLGFAIRSKAYRV